MFNISVGGGSDYLNNQGEVSEINQPDGNCNYSFATNLYSRLMNAANKGDVVLFKNTLQEYSIQAHKKNVKVSLQQSVHKIALHLSKNPYVDGFLIHNKKSIDSFGYEMSDEMISSRVLKDMLSIPGNDRSIPDFRYYDEIKDGVSSFGDLNDREIFNKAIQVPVEDLKSDGVNLDYSNVNFNGCSPNIKLQLTIKMSELHNKDLRISRIQELISEYSYDWDLAALESLTPVEIVEILAQDISSKNMPLEEKEAFLEDFTQKLVKELVGLNNLTDDYLVSIQEGSKIEGASYFHGWTTGGTLNSLFAFVDEEGKGPYMSTNLFVKQGASDCRGTNCIYAGLLNAGYQQIEGSDKEARVLYAKKRWGDDANKFQKCPVADHNVVLVKSADPHGECKVLDAFPLPFHGESLKNFREGTEVNGKFSQIVGACPYPKQQDFTL